MFVREMTVTHPQVDRNINSALIHCIEQCYATAQACTSCADACLGEDMLSDLVQCIHLNLDCADLCYTTGVIASRRSGQNDTVLCATLQACAEACARCAEECQRHADRMQHCQLCAEQCRRCEEACHEALANVGGGPSRLMGPITAH